MPPRRRPRGERGQGRGRYDHVGGGGGGRRGRESVAEVRPTPSSRAKAGGTARQGRREGREAMDKVGEKIQDATD